MSNQTNPEEANYSEINAGKGMLSIRSKHMAELISALSLSVLALLSYVVWQMNTDMRERNAITNQNELETRRALYEAAQMNSYLACTIFVPEKLRASNDNPCKHYGILLKDQ
jgi:hypothetical protein